MYRLPGKWGALYRAIGCCMVYAFVATTTLAQTLKVRKATAQDTYGGIAGSHSCRYSFELYGKDVPSITPDTLWIGTYAIPLGDDAETKWQKVVKGRTPTLTLYATVQFRNEYQSPSPIENPQKITHSTAAPAYKGVACLMYHWHGLHYAVTIPKITEQLPSISYP